MKIWRPYTQEMTAESPQMVKSASGAFLQLETGQMVFDGISSWWLITHGHNHPRIKQAILKQIDSLHQVVFANFNYSTAEKFAEQFSFFLPKVLNRMFFSDNGSTAVEVSMKMALQYAKQSGFEKKTKFLAFAKSYHGDTCGAMSLSESGPFTKNYQTLLFEIVRCRQGESVTDSLEHWTMDALLKIEEFSEQICALIIEPLVQGAGGMIVWPIEAIQVICEAARKKEILVIFDEVMTGFGRTGTLFAFEQTHFIPDFLCLSKGLTAGFLPMGLTITQNVIYESFLSAESNRMFFHGHSYTGNALSCSAALANLEIWKEEKSLEKLLIIESAHSNSLMQLKAKLPIKKTRVCGTIAAFDLIQTEKYGSSFSQKIFSNCLKKGVFIRPLGSTIYLMPPYCSTPQEIANSWEIIAEVITDLYEK